MFLAKSSSIRRNRRSFGEHVHTSHMNMQKNRRPFGDNRRPFGERRPFGAEWTVIGRLGHGPLLFLGAAGAPALGLCPGAWRS